jgi:hypothetical protein
MTGLALFALVISPALGLEPAVMGAAAFALGLLLESIINAGTAVRNSSVMRRAGDGDGGGLGGLARFALPLMLANLLGVAFQPMVARIAGLGGDEVTSKAALQILISWVWFFSSSLFAMQAMTIAHAGDRGRLRVLVRFGILVAGVFCAVFLVTALFPPLRDFVLVTLFKVEQADVHAFVTETLPLTVVFPVVVLARAILRGLIVRSGKTHWTIWTTVVGLVVLVGLQAGGLVSGDENGSFPAAWAWLLALLVEAVLSGLALLRIGLRRVYREGRPADFGASDG